MSSSEIPGRSKRAVFPRWLAPIYFAVVGPLALGAAPWGLSLLSARYGWIAGEPGLLNLFPLILVVAGIACLIWIVALHWVQAPEGWELETTPRYLLVRGPYKFTRNPTYLSVLAILLGWTLFYGSVAVFFGLASLGVLYTFVVVPLEERKLEARFGEAYLQYKNTVPRWFGKIQR
jgi:protein-S-isoprenylcysteine O-methyltransferase Ste14